MTATADPELVAERLRVLGEFLSRASLRGEKGVAIARLVLAVSNFGVLAAFRQLPGQSESSPDSVLTTGTLLGATLFSLWVFRWQAPRTPGRAWGGGLGPWLVASVLVDTALVATVIAGDVVWPKAGYLGALYDPGAALLLLAMVASGMRLSRFAAGVGCGAMAATGAVLVYLDLRWNAEVVRYGAVDMVVWMFYAVGATVIAFIIAARTKDLVYEGAEEAHRALRTRQRMGLYLSDEVAEEVLKDGGAVAGGAVQTIAVLFSDIRGFTRYAEKLPPETLVEELNAYLDAMVDAIGAEGGHVDKFIGDAIMSVFSISPRPDDAARALRAAWGMQAALERLNEARAAQGRPPLRHGIGVHYGRAIVGRIGHARRLEYTVIGDVVNVASRLESATKRLEVPVLVSREAADAARTSGAEVPALVRVDTIEVPGRDEAIEVFTLS